MLTAIMHHEVLPEPPPVSYVGQSLGRGIGTWSLTPPAGGQPGDLQLLALATHITVVPNVASYSGFTEVASVATTINTRFTLFRRVLTEGTAGETISGPNYDYSARHFRVYRGPTTATLVGSGPTNTTDSRVISLWLIRYLTHAGANVSGGGGPWSIATAPDLLNPVAPYSSDWYAGIVAGDEPGAPGDTAPQRTFTSAAPGKQYINIELGVA